MLTVVTNSRCTVFINFVNSNENDNSIVEIHTYSGCPQIHCGFTTVSYCCFHLMRQKNANCKYDFRQYKTQRTKLTKQLGRHEISNLTKPLELCTKAYFYSSLQTKHVEFLFKCKQ